MSQLVLARKRTEMQAVETELSEAEQLARRDQRELGHWLAQSFSAASLQSALSGLQRQQTEIQAIEQRCVAAESAVAAALEELHGHMRREEAVVELVHQQRVEHRRDGIREQQTALDDHSSRLWHQARLSAAEGTNHG